LGGVGKCQLNGAAGAATRAEVGLVTKVDLKRLGIEADFFGLDGLVKACEASSEAKQTTAVTRYRKVTDIVQVTER
jgi:hypothetical protein